MPQPFLHIGTTSGGKGLTLTGSDFERHKWIMGISGSGKSTFLAWIAVSLLRLGIAFCVIDPHGDLARHILSLLASSDFFKSKQAENLWFIDFARSERTIPFNVLKQPHFNNYQVANNLLEAIHRAFPTSTGTTASLDNTITYSAFVLAENGYPVTALQRFLLDSAFREKLLRTITDAQVRQFFDFKFAEKVNSQLIDSTMRRLDLLTFSLPLRHALGQQQNKLNFRFLMDNQMSCLFSLGGLDDQSKRLLGCLLLVGLEQAFLSRASVSPDLRLPYHVIVDEFPLFSASGDSFSVILEQVRKYKGTLYLAHQTLSQLQKGIMGSLGNAIPIIMKASTDDSSALVSRFYRPVQEKPPGFFDSLFGSPPPSSPFADIQNVTQARQLFETLQRQEALVTINHEVKRIVTPTLPMKEDRKLLARIEDMYAIKLLVPIAGNQAEETPMKPLLSLVSSAPTLARRLFVPGAGLVKPFSLSTGDFDTDILSCLFHFHYCLLSHLSALLGKKKSENYLRDKKLKQLIGDGLVETTQLARQTAGRPATVYYLTATGLKHIADTLDLPVPIQPGARKHLFLEHSLDCTDFLLAALELQQVEKAITVLDLKHERTVKASPIQVGSHRYVVPDGIIRLRANTPYGVGDDLGIAVEIDRNSEGKEKFLQKIEAYKRITRDAVGGLSSLTIAIVVTVGGGDRRNTLIEWSREAVHNHAVKDLFVFSAPDALSPTLFLTPSFVTVDNVPCALVEKGA